MKTILVPVDFSRTTRCVVAVAAELAERMGARITVLNVTQPRMLLKDHTKLENLVERGFAREGRPAKQRARVKVASLELIGVATPVILDQAQRLAADYIVMGAHRPAHRPHKRIGSTARGVVRGAKCPVVFVPAPTVTRRRTTARRGRRMVV